MHVKAPFVTTFAEALELAPAPKRLGDVALRFEPSMLIGETKAPLRSLWPTVIWAIAIVSTVLCIASLIQNAPLSVPFGLALLASLAFVFATWLERVDHRRRAFVVNFATTSVRLDFVTAIAGHPRTIVVHFDAVRAVAFLEQRDGLVCLVLDFVPSPESSEVLREVLVASIATTEIEGAERLHRVLFGAFGLGEAPPGRDGPSSLV